MKTDEPDDRLNQRDPLSKEFLLSAYPPKFHPDYHDSFPQLLDESPWRAPRGSAEGPRIDWPGSSHRRPSLSHYSPKTESSRWYKRFYDDVVDQRTKDDTDGRCDNFRDYFLGGCIRDWRAVNKAFG